METLQIALAIGFLIFVSMLLVLYAAFRRRVNLSERLYANSKGNEETVPQYLQKRLERFLLPIGEMIPRPPADMSRQERKLVQAGIRRKDAVLLFNAFHVVIAVCLLFVCMSTGYLYERPALYVLLSLFGGAAIPDIWLKSRIEARKLKIQHGLPDAMDLAVVSVEAGLGLDQALLRVGEEIQMAHPELADELRLRNLEVQMGRSRSESLRNLADRSGVEDIKALVAILIQTERFGTSIGQSLRIFSDALRNKRRQRAEEMAAKLAIKLIFPMAMFIFPAVFVVMLGPGFISILRNLLPALARH